MVISDELLTLAARLYYNDRVPQQEVAAMLNVSQAKVSRLLALARERGIVTITVNDYDACDHQLEQQLMIRWPLKKVVVIRVHAGQSAEQTRKLIGHFAAPWLTEVICAGMQIGLAGGRTIRELIEHYQPTSETSGITVIQLMGNVDPRISPTDASEIGRTLAYKGRGAFLTINAPVFAADDALCQELWRHRQLQPVNDAFQCLDLALVGIGTPENSILSEGQTLAAENLEQLRTAKVCGEICGRFFDADGNEAATSYRERTLGIPLEMLRRTPLVVGVVNGIDRVAAIAAAIKGKLINSLIIDSAGAKKLLASGL